MLIRARSSSRTLKPSGDENRRQTLAAASAGTSTDRFKWRISTRNNSGTQVQKRESNLQQRMKSPPTAAVAQTEVQSASDAIRHTRQVCTYSNYLELRKKAMRIDSALLSSVNATENAADTINSTDVPTRSRQNLSKTGKCEISNVTVAVRNAEEASAEETDNEESNGKCGCCSRVKKDIKDPAERRRRHLINQDERSGKPLKESLSKILDEDADLADLKDTDSTITLMPYVLFESERHKVLYQSVDMDQAELLKRAIALHANNLYKHMLMRLAMARYLKLIRESVVRTILSKNIKFILKNDAIAVNSLGIEIAAEDTRTVEELRASKTLSFRDFTFDTSGIQLPHFRSSQLMDSTELLREKFKPTPRLTDKEVLQLLRDGKVLDITGRASLESLISLPITRVGQRRRDI